MIRKNPLNRNSIYSNSSSCLVIMFFCYFRQEKNFIVGFENFHFLSIVCIFYIFFQTHNLWWWIFNQKLQRSSRNCSNQHQNGSFFFIFHNLFVDIETFLMFFQVELFAHQKLVELVGCISTNIRSKMTRPSNLIGAIELIWFFRLIFFCKFIRMQQNLWLNFVWFY